MRRRNYWSRNLLSTLCITVALVMLATMPAGAQMYFEDDFSEDVNDSGKWLIVSGDWTMDDETAVLSPGGSGHRHMLVAEDLWDETWTEYTIEAGVWVNTSADVFFKYAQMPGDASLDNYSWEIRSSTSHVIKYVGGAKTKPVDTTSTPGVSVETWYDIKLEVAEETVTAYMDGEELWSIDASDIPGGTVGLGGWKDGESRFDDVKIYGPDGDTPTAVSSQDKFAITWGEIKGF